MKLFYRVIGNGEPLVILHGLYGSSDNWISISRELSERYQIVLPDQRNHGQSSHSPEHSYQAMANDLLELSANLNLKQFYLMGHSMGGRVAMLFQSLHPSMVKKLIVVDVAPWSYQPEDDWFRKSFSEHETIIEAIKSIKPSNYDSRNAVDADLAKYLPNPTLRQFLMKNLKREGSNFEWIINIDALDANLEHLLLGIEVNEETAKLSNVLFIRGDESDYIPKNQIFRLKQFYPHSRVHSIPRTGHWLHAEQPQEFVGAVRDFLD